MRLVLEVLSCTKSGGRGHDDQTAHASTWDSDHGQALPVHLRGRRALASCSRAARPAKTAALPDHGQSGEGPGGSGARTGSTWRPTSSRRACPAAISVTTDADGRGTASAGRRASAWASRGTEIGSGTTGDASWSTPPSDKGAAATPAMRHLAARFHGSPRPRRRATSRCPETVEGPTDWPSAWCGPSPT